MLGKTGDKAQPCRKNDSVQPQSDGMCPRKNRKDSEMQDGNDNNKNNND